MKRGKWKIQTFWFGNFVEEEGPAWKLYNINNEMHIL
jgi:hypothetical protein